MNLSRGALCVLLIAVSAFAADSRASQPVEMLPTRCHVTAVPVWSGQADQQLIACGAEHPQNTLWHLDRADSIDGALDGFERRTATGKGVVVYVLDSGIRRDHVEFSRPTGPNVLDGVEIGGWESFTAPECASPALDPCPATEGLGVTLSHGTAVASIIGGARTGVAPGVTLVSVRVALGVENWLRALYAVIDHAYAPTTPRFRTAIVNISGGPSDGGSDALAALLLRMTTGVNARGESDPQGRRFLFVTAAGNGNADQCSLAGEVRIAPAIYGPLVEGVITVGGLSRANAPWEGSCGGAAVELLAPSEALLPASIAGDDQYHFAPEWVRSGTSYAAAYVSGMAARLLERNRRLYPAEIERLLAASPSRVAGLPVPVDTGWIED